MNDLNILDTKIIDPLVKASGFDKEQGRLFKNALSTLVVSQALLAVGKTLSEEEAKKLGDEVEKQAGDEGKLKALQGFIKNSPKVQKTLRDYLEKDLPDLIKNLVQIFAKSASEEQKKEFLKLSA